MAALPLYRATAFLSTSSAPGRDSLVVVVKPLIHMQRKMTVTRLSSFSLACGGTRSNPLPSQTDGPRPARLGWGLLFTHICSLILTRSMARSPRARCMLAISPCHSMSLHVRHFLIVHLLHILMEGPGPTWGHRKQVLGEFYFLVHHAPSSSH